MSENSVSDEERTKVYELCKTYLADKWSEVNENQLSIKTAPGGFVNKSYICFLPENIETQYKKVVVRIEDLYLGIHINRTHLKVIQLLFSENEISPKVLGTFESGVIYEYVQCRYFNANDDFNNKTVELLAQKVAKLHSLEAPIPKDSVEETFDLVFNKWLDKKQKESYISGVVRQEIQTKNYEFLSKLNYIEEIEWLRKTMNNLNSPIVLSHNDLNRRNILIKEDTTDIDIVFIDFDFSNYNYRGVDLGQYFAEYRMKVIDFGYVELPTDQQMEVFIDAYIKEMCKICGTSYAKQEINSRKQLIKEAKVFALFSFVKDIQYPIYLATYTDDKTYMSKAEERFQSYYELKNRILKEYNL